MKYQRKAEVSAFGVVTKALMAAYAVTGLLLLILALLVYKLNLKESVVETGILLIYLLASFAGGFLAGKLGKNRKFIWGLALGAGYVVILLLVSCGLHGSVQSSLGHILVHLVLCAGAGMLGGMLS